MDLSVELDIRDKEDHNLSGTGAEMSYFDNLLGEVLQSRNDADSSKHHYVSLSTAQEGNNLATGHDNFKLHVDENLQAGFR